jgi:hypothetical protein
MATEINNDLPLHPTDRKKIEEGRGQGVGPAYQAFIQCADKDCPKKGKRELIFGYKSGRNHNLLSLGEGQVLLLMDAHPDIEEVFDQWMIPFEESVAVAKAYGLQHHHTPGFLRAITVDFLCRRTNGEYFGRTFKLSADLADPDTLTKLDVERRWFEAKRKNNSSGWDWGIITELNLDVPRAENLRDLHAYRNPDKLGLRPQDILELRRWSEPLMTKAHSFKELAESTAQALELKTPDVLRCFRHFIATGLWQVDLSVRLNLSEPLICRKTKTTQPQGNTYVARAA